VVLFIWQMVRLIQTPTRSLTVPHSNTNTFLDSPSFKHQHVPWQSLIQTPTRSLTVPHSNTNTFLDSPSFKHQHVPWQSLCRPTTFWPWKVKGEKIAKTPKLLARPVTCVGLTVKGKYAENGIKKILTAILLQIVPFTSCTDQDVRRWSSVTPLRVEGWTVRVEVQDPKMPKSFSSCNKRGRMWSDLQAQYSSSGDGYACFYSHCRFSCQHL